MAKRLDEFPKPPAGGKRKYPWDEWADGSVWEIRRGEDYDVTTENMRVNLHMKAETLFCKARTHRIKDDQGEGLVFQFLHTDEREAVQMAMEEDPDATQHAMKVLYEDLLELYERARTEVTIERSDGRRQRYAPTRYKQQIDRGRDDGVLVPTVARIVRKPTTGFDHLENAERPDLMVETLVIDANKPYHRFFAPTTVKVAQERMDDYWKRNR